ncbi:unnamed protein product [Adineta steineri]|uniref:Uncharacterized protein n=1 Tax=Adineta steineri TaxID=433720 RepID=A0A815NQ24_9BILA|nr:unnamed protein product [Adineta steineri]CAF3995643.1 unnamed protein product [Adineta steineri]
MPNIKAELCVTIVSILIDVLNLGEQFGIYFAQKAEEMDEMKERQFFVIILSIGAITLFKSIFRNERIKIGISFLVEIGELLSYLLILERTLAVMVISLTFFGLQFVCYIITFYLVKTDDKTPTLEHRLKGFLRHLLFYSILNCSPLLTLFLNSESRFRQTLYEVSAIIGIFLSSMIYEIPMEARSVMNTWINRMRVQIETEQASLTPLDFREFMKNTAFT